MAQSVFLKTFVRELLPGTTLAVALLVASVAGAHWSIQLGILLCGTLWYRLIEKMPLPRFHYVAIAVAISCAALLEFAPSAVQLNPA